MFLATKLLQLDFQSNIYYTDIDYWSAQIAKRGSCKRQIAVFFAFERKNYFFIIKIFLKILDNTPLRCCPFEKLFLILLRQM